MNAKEYLSKARRLDVQIKFDLRELEHWRDLSASISGCNFAPHYNASRNIDPPFVKCIDKIVDLEEKIQKEINSLILLKTEILEKIHSLENVDHQSVLELRYLSYQTWEQIAEELHYSIRWIYKLHEKALQELEEKMEVEEVGTL